MDYMSLDRVNREANCELGLSACREQLKIETYVTAKEMCEPDMESPMGVMATLVQLKHVLVHRTWDERVRFVADKSKKHLSVGKKVTQISENNSILYCLILD